MTAAIRATVPPAAVPAPPLAAMVEEDALRATLQRTRPGSMAEALRLLRALHPETSLAARVAACQTLRP